MARGLGGVMVALAVRDGPALVRFQAKPLGELAQRESDRFASDRSWVRIPYSPLVVGPDIKMAPHYGIVAEWLRRLPAKQLCVARESSNLSNVVSSKQKVVGSSPTRSSHMAWWCNGSIDRLGRSGLGSIPG